MPYVNIPTFTGTNTEDMRKYIIRLTNELRYVLSNLDMSNMSDEIGEAVNEVKSVKNDTQSIISSLNLSGGKTAGRGGYLCIGPMVLTFGCEPVRFSGAPYGIGSCATTLSIRSGAGTQYGTLNVIPPYTPFSVISVSGNWVKVNYEGTEGYCAKGDMIITPIENTNNIYSCSVPLPVAVNNPSIILSIGGGEEMQSWVGEKTDRAFTFFVKRKESAAMSCELNWMAAGLRK